MTDLALHKQTTGQDLSNATSQIHRQTIQSLGDCLAHSALRFLSHHGRLVNLLPLLRRSRDQTQRPNTWRPQSIIWTSSLQISLLFFMSIIVSTHMDKARFQHSFTGGSILLTSSVPDTNGNSYSPMVWKRVWLRR